MKIKGGVFFFAKIAKRGGEFFFFYWFPTVFLTLITVRAGWIHEGVKHWSKKFFSKCRQQDSNQGAHPVEPSTNTLKLRAQLTLSRKIIVYSRNTINACSLLSHKWWVLLIKFMVRPTIHVRGESMHLWYSEST